MDIEDHPLVRYADSVREQTPPPVLYHYTTANGLLGILSAREIWATSIRALNDSREFILALDLAHAYLQEVESTAKSRVHCSLAHEWNAELSSVQTFDVYVTSFSEHGDLLSQWRSYGGGVGGYSVGLDGRSLKHLNSIRVEGQTVKVTNPAAAFHLLRCEYDEDAHRRTVCELVDKHLELYDAITSEQHRTDEDARRECRSTLITLLTVLAPSLKHSAFREEAEWRLVAPRVKVRDPAVRFRPGSSMLVPYLAAELAAKTDVWNVPEIVIGPTPHTDASRTTVRMLCEHLGITVGAINKSDAPYRAW